MIFILSQGQADIITLNTIDRGTYRDDGYNTPVYTTIGTGRKYNYILNQYLIFDLSSVSKEVISAEFRIVCDYSYFSYDPYETYTLFDVTNSYIEVYMGYGDNLAVYNDLGSGVVYGTVNVISNYSYETVTVTLNRDGLAALNACLGGIFMMGGSLTSIDNDDDYEILFSYCSSKNAGDGYTQLILTTVPEPSTLIFFSVGLWFLFHQRRRQGYMP